MRVTSTHRPDNPPAWHYILTEQEAWNGVRSVPRARLLRRSLARSVAGACSPDGRLEVAGRGHVVDLRAPAPALSMNVGSVGQPRDGDWRAVVRALRSGEESPQSFRASRRVRSCDEASSQDPEGWVFPRSSRARLSHRTVNASRRHILLVNWNDRTNPSRRRRGDPPSRSCSARLVPRAVIDVTLLCSGYRGAPRLEETLDGI